MKVGIMQPYFLPYIGYFQLIAAVDLFIIYDNIKYTKKGWINRNRMLLNGSDTTFSLPLKKDSDSLDVIDREISADFDRQKFLNQIQGAYYKAPEFENIFPVVKKIVNYENSNLFQYIYHSVLVICNILDLNTKIITSSEISINHELKGQDKVIALCNSVNGSTYINTAGGIDLYSKEFFNDSGLQLNFIKALPFDYPQLGDKFVPWLSIIDILMFNTVTDIKNIFLKKYQII